MLYRRLTLFILRIRMNVGTISSIYSNSNSNMVLVLVELVRERRQDDAITPTKEYSSAAKCLTIITNLARLSARIFLLEHMTVWCHR